MKRLIPYCFSLFLMAGLFMMLSPHNARAQQDENAMPGIYTALTQTPDWLNTSRTLTPDDLKGRVILIDFWTYCCINCIHVMPKLKKLESEFGDKLTVIGVHSAKFTNEGETENIREAIQKYGLEHPVVNDADFRIWNSFGVNAWPTLLLVGPDGLLKHSYRGEGDLQEMRMDIAALIKKTGDKLVTAALPIALEKDKIPPTILRFPTKLDRFDNKTIVISDSGHQRILVVDLETHKIIHTIGSGTSGFNDGTFQTAAFSDPQGVLVDGDKIFVADTGNHRLRQIDLKTKRVTTLAGTGARGNYRVFGSRDALDTALASPWDLAFYPDTKTITIANAGTHQLWSYDRKKKTISTLAGNGQESIDDGSLPLNSLSQPSGLSIGADNALYFVDAETSSLRVLKDGAITTLIGTGLFDFGLQDGPQGTGQMQHATGLYADGDTIYIADTYNHAIREYHDGELKTLVKTGLKEPNDIQKIGDVFYIADTNNHRILMMEDDGDIIGALDIMPMDKPIAYQEKIPNILTLDDAMITPDATLKFELPKKWHLNPLAPSYVALFDADKKTSVLELKNADFKNGMATLSGLEAGKTYTLQGVLYYCETAKGSQCLIRGVMNKVAIAADGSKELPIPLPIPAEMK